MAELAKVDVAAAPACPGCRRRLTGLPLDDMVGGDEYQCPFCSQVIRMPQQVLTRLIEQREARRRELASTQPSLLQKIANFFSSLFK